MNGELQDLNIELQKIKQEKYDECAIELSVKVNQLAKLNMDIKEL